MTVELRLSRVERKIELRIQKLQEDLEKLFRSSDSSIISSSAIVVAVSSSFASIYDEVRLELPEVRNAYLSEYKLGNPTLSDRDIATLELFSRSALSIVRDASDKLSRQLTVLSLDVSLEIKNKISKLREILSGSSAKRMSFLRYLTYIFSDLIYGFLAILGVSVGLALGLRTFRYAGGLIRDSREFCKERDGRTYTLEQIREWNGLQWKGKIQGSVFIYRGGHNCRHYFVPVL